MKKTLAALLVTFCVFAHGVDDRVKGFSLTETWKYRTPSSKFDPTRADEADQYQAVVVDQYDAVDDASLPKTPAQQRVDSLFDIGVRRINLSPQAFMIDPKESTLRPNTRAGSPRRQERARYTRLIKYINSKGMTVGIRPIFFVLSKDGNPDFVEMINGKPFHWWHGNIQPADPNTWFESFRSYLKEYYSLASLPGVEEFTIGAELYSMTVGVEDQWKANPYGFPAEWVKVLAEARSAMPKHVKIMYDINFTDERVDAGTLSDFGGEFARWSYRLTGIRNPDPKLVEFWKGLDRVGIDMYRSLATEAQGRALPAHQDDIIKMLRTKTDLYAQQIDQTLEKIATTLGTDMKEVVLKEIGYASRNLGFIDPFDYPKATAALNIAHQAAAYEAIFQAFWKNDLDWMKGIVFWDASVNGGLHGPGNNGFSVIGKPDTEKVIKSHW
jgi:hypothetical protein